MATIHDEKNKNILPSLSTIMPLNSSLLPSHLQVQQQILSQQVQQNLAQNLQQQQQQNFNYPSPPNTCLSTSSNNLSNTNLANNLSTPNLTALPNMDKKEYSYQHNNSIDSNLSLSSLSNISNLNYNSLHHSGSTQSLNPNQSQNIQLGSNMNPNMMDPTATTPPPPSQSMHQQLQLQQHQQSLQSAAMIEKCTCRHEGTHIPRPRNAFILFRQQHHQSVLDEGNVIRTNPDVSRELGKRWRNLPAAEKDHWNQLAEKEKKRHAEKYPGYRYTPRRFGKKGCVGCRNKAALQQQQQQQQQSNNEYWASQQQQQQQIQQQMAAQQQYANFGYLPGGYQGIPQGITQQIIQVPPNANQSNPTSAGGNGSVSNGLNSASTNGSNEEYWINSNNSSISSQGGYMPSLQYNGSIPHQQYQLQNLMSLQTNMPNNMNVPANNLPNNGVPSNQINQNLSNGQNGNGQNMNLEMFYNSPNLNIANFQYLNSDYNFRQ